LRQLTLFLALAAGLAAPALARDSLGVFDEWAAFRDPANPRCYAIAAPDQSAGRSRFDAYASVGYWPRQGVRGQPHFRLSRAAAKGADVTLTIGTREFALTGGGADAWGRDKRMDAAIIAAIRRGETMRVSTRDGAGNRIRDSYSLKGAATALDAAALGCARR